MSILGSLQVDAFGLAVVFMVLIVLSLIIKLFSKILAMVGQKKDRKEVSISESALDESEGTVVQYSNGELKLIDVDEKTAALIMAIVSDECEIPLSKLDFKSIRLVK